MTSETAPSDRRFDSFGLNAIETGHAKANRITVTLRGIDGKDQGI